MREVRKGLVLVAVCAAVLAAPAVALAGAFSAPTAATKVVSYHGYRLRVPRDWPVFDLARNPATCVRFNRHAIYLGRPSPVQRCPADELGRTEAILIAPGGATVAGTGMAGGVATFTERGGRLSVIATFDRHPSVIERALGLSGFRALAAAAPRADASSQGTSAAARSSLASRVRTQAATRSSAAAPARPGAVFKGKGFDACATPSTKTMSAWAKSPYRAIGVYIGGANRGCSQPNLTASWAETEAEAGWHLIPIYVGLQAPSNGCGCKSIKASSAGAEGTAAAQDAVTDAQAIGLGSGNPLYYDMEGYTRSSSTTNAVLKFLSAWTEELHTEGYLSGVYSSGASGIADLASKWGTSYAEPDEIWVADWNGQASVQDPYLPSGDWPKAQRLHQYDGGSNETYGGHGLNIDRDYLDASTAAYGAVGAQSAPPSAWTPPVISGYGYVGQKLTEHHGGWSGDPTSYTYQWYRCASLSGCAAITGATAASYKLQAADVGYAISVFETARNTAGAGTPAKSAWSQAIQARPSSSYWLFTARGNVYNSIGASFYGSTAHQNVSTISGMASSPGGDGYWLVERSGHVFDFGQASKERTFSTKHQVAGIVASPGGGYYLFTAYGNIYNAGAHFYGSPTSHRIKVSTICGMAVTDDGRGYWLVDRAGRVFSYGDARRGRSLRSAGAVRGIVASANGGYWLWTYAGRVYARAGATFYGSPYRSGVRSSSFSGMAPSSDGEGYWLVERRGQVLPYGDAPSLAPARPAAPILGIVG